MKRVDHAVVGRLERFGEPNNLHDRAQAELPGLSVCGRREVIELRLGRKRGDHCSLEAARDQCLIAELTHRGAQQHRLSARDDPLSVLDHRPILVCPRRVREFLPRGGLCPGRDCGGCEGFDKSLGAPED